MKKFFDAVRHLPFYFFKLLLCLSATSYVIAVFLIKQKFTIRNLENFPACISYVLYLFAPVAIAAVCLLLTRKLTAVSVECQIKEVELANNTFLPIYLGYFFVALSVPDMDTFQFVYLIVFAFTYLSQSLCFNPLFLLFKYQFYFVTAEDGTKIFLITKQNMKSIEDVELDNLRRINDFTYIDIKKRG